ncbi:MAG TPA: hypothetical protein VEH31_05645 [Streptosporangiaceae bacterium]|nr:hypothetical protein [Streptosporangiaceae bacterium]
MQPVTSRCQRHRLGIAIITGQGRAALAALTELVRPHDGSPAQPPGPA